MLAFLDSPLVSSDFGRRRVGLWSTKLLVERETTSCTRGRRNGTSLSSHGSKISGSQKNRRAKRALRESGLFPLHQSIRVLVSLTHFFFSLFHPASCPFPHYRAWSQVHISPTSIRWLEAGCRLKLSKS